MKFPRRARWPGDYRGEAYVGQIVCRAVVVAETAYKRSRSAARRGAWVLLHEMEVRRRQLELRLL